jgi:hypothetical protein
VFKLDKECGWHSLKEFFFLDSKEREEIVRKITAKLQLVEEIIFAYLYGSFLNSQASFRDVGIALFVDQNKVSKS